MEKIFEKLVHQKLHQFLKGKLTDMQHGFMSNKSTVTNLLEHAQDIADGIDRGDQIDTLFLDMSQAFDKVNHKRLLDRLSQIGVRGHFLQWFKSYLASRKVCVVFNGSTSDPFFHLQVFHRVP